MKRKKTKGVKRRIEWCVKEDRGKVMEVLCFFFQAEDGIRDWSVTGVQTCALPIGADHQPSTTGAGHLPSTTGAGHLPSTTGAGNLP